MKRSDSVPLFNIYLCDRIQQYTNHRMLTVLLFLTMFIKATINKWQVNIMYGQPDHLAT